MNAPIIGLTGRLGSGKDTVFERMSAIFPETYVRQSFADPLKESIAALFGVSLYELEVFKRDPDSVVVLGDDAQEKGDLVSPTVIFTMREFMQRYGTEAHRDIFGTDFWVDTAMRKIQEYVPQPWQGKRDDHAPTFVFTDVRFDNEAEAIRARGGEIWEVRGPDEDTGSHASEAGIDPYFITLTIDNTVRRNRINGVTGEKTPDFDRLDAQIVAALQEYA